MSVEHKNPHVTPSVASSTKQKPNPVEDERTAKPAVTSSSSSSPTPQRQSAWMWLSHSAWAGIGGIAAVIGMVIAVVAILLK